MKVYKATAHASGVCITCIDGFAHASDASCRWRSNHHSSPRAAFIPLRHIACDHLALCYHTSTRLSVSSQGIPTRLMSMPHFYKWAYSHCAVLWRDHSKSHLPGPIQRHAASSLRCVACKKGGSLIPSPMASAAAWQSHMSSAPHADFLPNHHHHHCADIGG
eukprot:scaffold84454_cov20-Tisochrysis_lutea.AAC.4